MALPEQFKGLWRVWVDRDAGAVVEAAESSAPVCFVGYTGDGKADIETAEHIAELHNQSVQGDDPRQGRLPV